jgi:hypothetical protein
MKRTFVYDRDLDAMVEVTPWSNRPKEARPSDGVQIIRDLDTYRTVAGDVANGGDPVTIGGRRQHREFLARNNYVEAGNELSHMGKKPEHWTEARDRKVDLINDIKRAAGWL